MDLEFAIQGRLAGLEPVEIPVSTGSSNKDTRIRHAGKLFGGRCLEGATIQQNCPMLERRLLIRGIHKRPH
jgi:hypothetical protein